MSYLEIKNVSFAYRENNHVINQVSLKIEKGQYVAILGHNGSGKSTLAKLIVGLLEASSGTISFDDMVLTVDNVYDFREHIALVFQNPDNQFIGATVRDDIAFGLENKCMAPEKMEEIIQTYAGAVNMLDYLDHEPTKLSGGQKQRVAIAGALAMLPDIIILDEATSMLDPKGKHEVNDLVHQLKAEGRTILSITHDVEEAAFADRILVMDQGKIVMDGSPLDILTQTANLVKLQLDVPFSVKVAQALNLNKQDDVLDLEKVVAQAWALNSKK